MQKLRYYYSGIIFILLLIIGCVDNDDFEKFIPKELTVDEASGTVSGVVQYTDLETYPYLDTISTAMPIHELKRPYRFAVDSVKAPDGSTYNFNKFFIDADSSSIHYDNRDGLLSPGEYSIWLRLTTGSGVYYVEEAIKLNILEIPLTLNIDNSTASVGALDVTVLATVNYTETLPDVLTSVKYSFVNGVDSKIYSIDETTGEITKYAAESKSAVDIGVKVTTNLGEVSFPDILAVDVGPYPTFKYLQSGGGDLAKVTVSPWTAWTSATPELMGMDDDGGYEVVLPPALSAYSGSFSFGADGEFIIAADGFLPEGDHTIGVTVTNGGGISAPFSNRFTLSVEKRWILTPIIDEALNETNHAVAPEVAYPGTWIGYTFQGTGAQQWKKVYNVTPTKHSAFRRLDPGNSDAGLVRIIDLTDIKGLRFTFGELVGYGVDFINNHNRALYYGDEVTNAASGNFVSSDWNTIMAEDDTAWKGINWNASAGPAQVYSNIEVDLSKISGSNLYIMWRMWLKPTSSAGVASQYFIDDFSAQKADVFTAEEE